MSVCFFLQCNETHQCVHVATKSMGSPGGSNEHELVIQMFSIAHSSHTLSITTDPTINDPNYDCIEWDLFNSIELYKRMTGEMVSKGIANVIQ